MGTKPLSREAQRQIIDLIIYHRMEGDSCLETAENYIDEVKFDPELHAAMSKLINGASDMIRRLKELNSEYDLEYNTDDI